MSLEEDRLNQNEGVRGLLKEYHKAELGKILAFGEKYREEGNKMKVKFWRRYDRAKYLNLVRKYKDNKEVYIEKISGEEKEILDRLNEVGKDKFIEEYMHDKILYSGNADMFVDTVPYLYHDYHDLMDGEVIMEEGMSLNLYNENIGAVGAEALSKMELKEGVILNLSNNNIGAAGAEAISKMELKEGVTLNLSFNGIGDEGAKAISGMELKEGVELGLRKNHIGDEGAEALSKMKLKEGVRLTLTDNNIGAEGAEAISKMELKEGVGLYLGHNNIGDAGAEAIMQNMELKKGVRLWLNDNNISKEMEDKLIGWAQGYINNGIDCEVKV